MMRLSEMEARAFGLTARSKRKTAVGHARSRKVPSQLEESFAAQILKARLAPVTREYKFDATRRWRLDFAWPDLRVAVEIEGGVWTNGGHTRGAGYVKNLEKYNAATAQGWRLFRFHEGTIKSGEAIRFVTPFVRPATHSPGWI